MKNTGRQEVKAIGNHYHILAPKQSTCRLIEAIKLHCF